MKHRSLSAIILVIIMAFSGIAATKWAAAQSGFPSSPTLPPGCPTDDLWQRGGPKAKFNSDIVRQFRCRPQHKTVEVEWRYTSQPLPTAAVPDNQLSSAREVFATAYWPTYVLQIDNYHFCVAGKGRIGDVVIEYWKFDSVSLGGAPAPAVNQFVLSGSTTASYNWTFPPRVSVVESQRAVATPTGLVRAMFRDPGSDQHVYVWYDGSRALCRLALATGALVVDAAPVASSGVIGVPQLASRYDSCWSADYAQKGYCYIFVQIESDGVTPKPDILALIDSNRDGKIDSSSSISGAAWVANGWSDHSAILASY